MTPEKKAELFERIARLPKQMRKLVRRMGTNAYGIPMYVAHPDSGHDGEWAIKNWSDGETVAWCKTYDEAVAESISLCRQGYDVTEVYMKPLTPGERMERIIMRRLSDYLWSGLE